MATKVNTRKFYKSRKTNNYNLSPRHDSSEECRASYLFVLGGFE